VRCWGNNADGQLGRGNVLDVGLAQGDMPPGFVSLPVTAVSIHAGGYSASGVNGPLEEDRFCAVGANGEVLCWGNGTGAALGTGQPGNVGDEPGEIPPTQSLTGGAVDGLKIGAFSACYWRSGDVRCWGATNVTLLGEVIGDDPLELPPPSLPVQPTDGIIALDIGFLAACWLDSTATLKCWGFNNAGNLGAGFDENIDENNIPSRVPYDANAPGMVAVDVSMGLVHTCVLGQMGEVVCWGSGAVSNVNGDANLGDGPDEIPAPLPFGEPVHRLSKSSGTNGHECVILSSGRVSCWGAAAPERVTFGYGSDDVLVSPAQVGVRRVPLW
jgi:alpha-tubulin suppressor-like RCC1 family protein